jgi:hypothetical protein
VPRTTLTASRTRRRAIQAFQRGVDDNLGTAKQALEAA